MFTPSHAKFHNIIAMPDIWLFEHDKKNESFSTVWMWKACSKIG